MQQLQGLQLTIPSAVANKASAIPGATIAKLVFLEIAIDWNEFIIPQTVPNKPINGAVDPTVAKKVNLFQVFTICFSILTSSILLILSLRLDLFFAFNKVCIESLNNEAIGFSKFNGKVIIKSFC